MKRTVALLTVLIGACTAPSEGTKLIGDWTLNQGSLRCTNSFHADGTFAGQCFDKETEAWAFSGSWSLRGDALSYKYEKSSLKQIPPGTSDADKLVALGEDYYVVQGRDGAQRRYLRTRK